MKLRNATGQVIDIGEDDPRYYIDRGYTPDTAEAQYADVKTEAAKPEGEGLVGAINAGVTSFLSGATLGLSDIALSSLMTDTERKRLLGHREDHSIVSAAGQIAGGILPALAAPESLLGQAPAGVLSRATGALAAEGIARGGVTGTVTALTAGAAEGALQNAGSYLSDVALGDRKLSAEGMFGALGAGGAFGAAGGAVAMGIERGTMAARRMFSRAQGTERAAMEAEQAWKATYDSTIEAHQSAADEARAQLADAQATRMRAQLTKQQIGASEAAGRAAVLPEETGLEGLIRMQRLSPEKETELAVALSEHDAALVELETALQRLEVPAIEPGVTSRAVPIDEFGAPGSRGIKTPEEISDAALKAGDDAPVLESTRQLGRPVHMPEGTPVEPRAATDVGMPGGAVEQPVALEKAVGTSAVDAPVAKTHTPKPVEEMSLDEVDQFQGELNRKFDAAPSGSPEYVELSRQWDQAVARRLEIEQGIPMLKAPKFESSPMDEAEFDAYAADWRGTISPETEQAFQVYTKNGAYSHINAPLRKGEGLASLPEDLRTIAGQLDSGIETARSPREMTVSRGVSGNRSIKQWRDADVGDEIVDPGFGSTSNQLHVGRSYAKGMGVRPGVEIHIRVPEGFPAAPVPSDVFGAEREILLPRNVKYKITKIEDLPDGSRAVYADASRATEGETSKVAAVVRRESMPIEEMNLSQLEDRYSKLDQQRVAADRARNGDEVKRVRAEMDKVYNRQKEIKSGALKEPSGEAPKPAPVPAADEAAELAFVNKSAAKNALFDYQNGAHIDINDYARTGKVREGSRFADKGEADEVLSVLDNATTASTLDKETVTYRGIGSGRRGPERGIKGEIKVGSTFEDPGYSSVSTSRKTALDYTNKPGSTLLEVEMPAGTKYGAVPDDGLGESEWLLPRGAKYRVTSIGNETINGRDVRVVRTRLESAGDLESLLAGTKQSLDAGGDLKQLGAPARQEYAAAKQVRTAEAGAYFRGKAVDDNYAGSAMAADERAMQMMASERRAGLSTETGLEGLVRAQGQAASHGVEDLPRVAEAFTKYERKSAELVEAMGPSAPPAAQESAKAFRAAEAEAERKTMARTTRAIDDSVEQPAPAARPKRGKAPSPEQAAYQKARADKLAASTDLDRARIAEIEQRMAREPAKPSQAMLTADADLQAARANETAAKLTSRDRDRKLAAVRAEAEKARPAVPTASPQSQLGAVMTAAGIAGELGVPGIPDPSQIPIVGPLLSVYLKYRALKFAAGRFVGRVAATGDTKAAALAARTQERVTTAVDRTLGLVSAAAAKGRRPMVIATTVLGHRLFDDGEPDAPKGADARELAAVRIREVATAAARPELVTAYVRREMRGVTDPDLIEAAEQHLIARFQYLNGVLPKAPPPNPYTQRQWKPSQAEASNAAQILSVVHDPEAAFIDTTPAKAQALGAIYPQLLKLAQQRLIDRIGDVKHPIPYQQRLRSSLLFGVQLDDSLDPASVQTLQSGFALARPEPTPQPASPPVSSIAADTNLTNLYQTGMDRRAMR